MTCRPCSTPSAWASPSPPRSSAAVRLPLSPSRSASDRRGRNKVAIAAIIDEAASGTRPDVAHELATVAERLRRSTVQVRGRGPGGGSGVIWRPDGLIITNAHVARGPRATVELWHGRVLDATVTTRNAQRDLAALAVDA